MEDRLLTKTEGADALRCSKPTLERIIQRGDLPVVRVGERSIRISETAVREYISSRTERRGR